MTVYSPTHNLQLLWEFYQTIQVAMKLAKSPIDNLNRHSVTTILQGKIFSSGIPRIKQLNYKKIKVELYVLSISRNQNHLKNNLFLLERFVYYLFERQSERESRLEKDIIHLLVPSSNICNSQGQSRTQSGTRIYIQGVLCGQHLPPIIAVTGSRIRTMEELALQQWTVV